MKIDQQKHLRSETHIKEKPCARDRHLNLESSANNVGFIVRKAFKITAELTKLHHKLENVF